VSGPEIEMTVIRAVREQEDALDEQTGLMPRELIETFVVRVVARPQRLTLTLKTTSAPIEVPWNLPRKRDLSQMEHNPTEEDRRAPNLQLVQAVVHSHA
jgi:hypothetical protein